MTRGAITPYVPPPSPYLARSGADDLPVHPAWRTFASARSVRGLALARRQGRLWLATWGGVLSWRWRGDEPYRRYGSEQGLGGTAVACIGLDRDEQPWVGQVEGGLSYFDGARWRVYPHLWDEPVLAVCGAADGGGVWAATADTVYRVAAPDRPPTPVADRGATEATGALALLADGDGVLLGNDWGLFRLGEGGEPRPIERGTIAACSALARDPRGRLWIGTPAGLRAWQDGRLGPPLTPADSEPMGQIVALAAGSGRVWVLTTLGLAVVADGRWRRLPAAAASRADEPPTPRAIAVDANDAFLWVGTDDLLAGVSCPGPGEAAWYVDQLTPRRDDALSNLGRCIAAGPTAGQVCVGTAGGLAVFGAGDDGTLDTFDASTGDVQGLCAPAAEPAVASADAGAAPGPGPWLATWPGRVRPWRDPAHQAPPRPPGPVLALALDREGRPHALTSRGLWRLDADRPRPVGGPPPSDARCLAELPDDGWWVGTATGAYVLDRGDQRWRLAGEPTGPLQAPIADLLVRGDTLWVGAVTGLWARRHDAWMRHGPPPPADPWEILALAPASRPGALWLARTDGIVLYDPAEGRTSEPVTPATSGLPGRRVVALLEQDDALWVVTRTGVGRWSLKANPVPILP